MIFIDWQLNKIQVYKMGKKAKSMGKKQFYKIESIVDCRQTPTKGKQYLIKWKNFPFSQNTWEPTENLQTAQLLIQNFQTFRQQPTLFDYFRKIPKNSSTAQKQSFALDAQESIINTQQKEILMQQEEVLSEQKDIEIIQDCNKIQQDKVLESQRGQEVAEGKYDIEVSICPQLLPEIDSVEQISSEILLKSENNDLSVSNIDFENKETIKKRKKIKKQRKSNTNKNGNNKEEKISSQTDISLLQSFQNQQKPPKCSDRKYLHSLINPDLIIENEKGSRQKAYITRKLLGKNTQNQQKIRKISEDEQMKLTIEEQLEEFDEENDLELFYGEKGLSVELKNEKDERVCLSLKEISMVNSWWIKDMFQSFI